MRTTKKVISLLLSLLLILTTVSVCFSSLAAGTSSVTAAQWTALENALALPGVGTATYSTNGKTTAVADTTGNVMTAAAAYFAVFSAMIDTGASNDIHSNSSYRTSTQIKSSIQSKIQSDKGSSFINTYNVGAVLDAFNAKQTVTTTNNSSNSLSYDPIVISITDARSLLDFASVADVPNDYGKTTTYTITHRDATYKYLVVFTRHYLRVDTVTSSTDSPNKKALLTTLETAVSANAALFAKTRAQLVAMSQADITAAYNVLNDAYTAVNAAFTPAEMNHFFDVTAIEALLTNLNFALTVQVYTPIIAEINELCAVDFSGYTLAQLEVLLNTLQSKYNGYVAISDQDIKDYLETEEGFSPEDVAIRLAAIQKAYDLARLRELKETIDAAKAVYDAYDEEKATSGEITGQQITLAIGEISGYITALGTYNAQDVLEICGEGYVAALTALTQNLGYLLNVLNYQDAFSEEYAYYVSTVYSALDWDDDSGELLFYLAQYDSWYGDLLDFIALTRENFGDEVADLIFQTLDKEITGVINAKYQALITRFETEVNTAYDYYERSIAAFGDEITIVNADNYSWLKQWLSYIETDVKDFLDASEQPMTYSEEAAQKYDILQTLVLDAYEDFVATGGFSKFETQTVDSITRYVSPQDVARDKDYDVPDEKLEAIIDILDRALQSDLVKDSLGLDLSALLSPDLLNKLYTNEFLNTLIQILYPLVGTEFAKVWADLPDVVQADNPVGSGKIDVTLTLYTLEQALKSIKLPLYPTLLAENVESAYPDVAALLRQANTPVKFYPTTDTEYEHMDDPWQDEVLLDEDGKLVLDWGITDKESFLQAASAALSGLEPLLLALLCNQRIVGNHANEPTGSEPGHGKVGTGKTSVTLVIIPISVTVDPITLYLDVAGNSGYNNLVIPILEALDLDADLIPNGDNFTSTRQVLEEGIIEPLEAVLQKAAEAPLDYILRTLPNLAYGLNGARLFALLSELKTVINYHADAHYSAVGGLAAGNIDEALQSEDPIDLNVGEMLNLKDLGVDLLSLNGLLDLVRDGLDLPLPKLDAGKLAQLATITERDTKRSHKTYTWGDSNKAVYLNANRADVLLFLLDYAVEAFSNPDVLDKVLDLQSKSDAEDPEAVKELPEILTTIIQNVLNNSDDSVAALTELVYPQEYTMPEPMTWRAPREGSGDEPLVTYSETWTREKAQYVADNLDSLIDNLLLFTGVRWNGTKIESLSDLVKAALKSFVNADTVNDLAAKLRDLFGGLNLPEGVAELLKTQVGLDIHAWDTFSARFKAGNLNGMRDALLELVAPFGKLLGFLIADQTLTISLTDSEGEFRVFELNGYDGYSYGIIPLLESLGAESVKTPAAFLAEPENAAKNILDPLFEVLNRIADAPYDEIIATVPTLLYYLASDGLTTAVDHVLFTLNTVLDIIRPIYDVNLNELIGFDIRFAEQDPVSFLLNTVSASIEEASGMRLKVDFTADSLFDQFGFGAREAYTSANGETAYRIVPRSEDEPDMLTAVLRFAVGQLIYSENATQFAKFAKQQFNLSKEGYAFLYATLYALRYVDTNGVDGTLGVMYWIFYGADTAADAYAKYYKYYAYDWAEIIRTLTDSKISYLEKAGYLMTEVYKTTFKPLYEDYLKDKINNKVDEIIEGIPVEEIGEKLSMVDQILLAVKQLLEAIQAIFHFNFNLPFLQKTA